MTTSSIALRIRSVPCSNHEEEVEVQVTDPLPAPVAGLLLGSSSAAFKSVKSDSEMDAKHGTLECTTHLGVWVYSDHSVHGSLLNGQRVHNDAVVVRNGDKLQLGRTEIELWMETPTVPLKPQADTELVSPVEKNERKIQTSARVSRRRASSPWSGNKAQEAKQRLPKIDTSSLAVGETGEFVQPLATPPEYTASPIPGARWRRKRNSIATSTLTAQKSPAPPLEENAQPHSAFHRSRSRFVQGPDFPRSVEVNAAATEKTARPPPLDYSSSPIVSPSAMSGRQRHNLFQQPPISAPSPAINMLSNIPPPPFSAGSRAAPRRDDLRIQVSKKMAAAAPSSAGKANAPHVAPKVADYQAPASPVAQRDILRQQESLQTVLQHKYEEEQLLKQQQEVWMKQQMSPLESESENRSGSSNSTPQMSPIKEINTRRKTVGDIDLDELSIQAPALLRTLSLGISGQRTIKPSPRLAAAIRASRSRLNSFEDRSSEPSTPKINKSRWRRRSMELALSPNKSARKIILTKRSDELRSSGESVASSAATEITCHRRVTRSLSLSPVSAGSVDLTDFLGYEDDEDATDIVTSYTSPELYGSAELLRCSRDDTTLLFDANRDSNNSVTSLYGSASSSPPLSSISSRFSSSKTTTHSAEMPLESPRRRGPETANKAEKTETLSSSNNQIEVEDDFNSSLESRVRSPRGGQFDPRSPSKSTAAFKNHQQHTLKMQRPPPEPQDGDDGEHQKRHQLGRRRPSFRRHVPPSLDNNN
ncbi:hypothetical protein PHYBOEH_009814 [Phytophthora boehmeriae]|uniref:FHA domain-containing protein n=1 Tax=Phytophthora boehmeriae TaxID=109152 RepID=A0A8T1VRV8_9STRA|nr:hypothetical protein PHYBOEH_009814 [Phytophthora boehmeriae]